MGRDEEIQTIVQQAVAMLSEYDEKLRAKNITIDFKHDRLFFKFVLCYVDGQRYGFKLDKDQPAGGIPIYKLLMIPEMYGQGGSEKHWVPQINKDWSLAEFERFVQGIIDEFFAAADKHQGYKGAPNSGWDS